MNSSEQTYHEDGHGKGRQKVSSNPEQIQNEVEETRDRLESRLDSLTYSLSPGELLDHALSMARQNGGEFGGNLGRQVKNNPLPLILSSVGISWLMMSSKSPGYEAQQSEGQGSALKERMGGAWNKASGAMEGSADRARQIKGNAGQGLHSSMGGLQSSMQNSQEELTRFFREQPVLAGSLGVALGASLGALFRETPTEDHLMGGLSDEAKAKAKEAGSEHYEKAREKSEEAMQATKNQGDEGSSRTSSPSASSASSPSASASASSRDSGPGVPRP